MSERLVVTAGPQLHDISGTVAEVFGAVGAKVESAPDVAGSLSIVRNHLDTLALVLVEPVMPITQGRELNSDGGMRVVMGFREMAMSASRKLMWVGSTPFTPVDEEAGRIDKFTQEAAEAGVALLVPPPDEQHVLYGGMLQIIEWAAPVFAERQRTFGESA